MALAWEQLVTATAEAQKLRASVVRKRVRGLDPSQANAALR